MLKQLRYALSPKKHNVQTSCQGMVMSVKFDNPNNRTRKHITVMFLACWEYETGLSSWFRFELIFASVGATYRYEKTCWLLRLKVSDISKQQFTNSWRLNEALISSYSYT